MKTDPRFARAVNCSVEANHKTHDGRQCEVYAFPIHFLHAIFLTIGVIAIAAAAELIFESRAIFWISGILAMLALLPDADLFSFAMTESITFCLYSVAALVFISGLKASSINLMLFGGCLYGVLVLTRASFAALTPVLLALIVIHALWVVHSHWKYTARLAMALAVGWTAMVGPWLVRNAISTGHWGLTEEYGSAALIERFAFNKMSLQETLLAFPYCLPGIGEPLVETAFGPKAMERFVYYTPDSFFHVGRAHRDKLVEISGRLDPLIGAIAKQEITQNWWRHLVQSATSVVRNVGSAIGSLLVCGRAIGIGTN